MNAGDLLLDPTTRSFNENVLQLHKKKSVILRSRLKDGEAAILGASSLIQHGAEEVHKDRQFEAGFSPTVR